ncbi:uncharacterized protein TRAVEDRAFT_61929 [Trametes versicolor FP-101664 SS1]|uniref:uncharacterized protein n=1 Tax=Trametes versicolor (strain FP-101664) TaxID=717944 RepID=UPI0004623FFB|nr:uncharacterized protein TRAVEDRAFT_61929 [Trametes versicolor FP-101664 SS1]EIW64249.1 hypothetical protein TRAVEDRAFT_61929 [Trametes versicolor FP-101664 SS1]
MHRAVELPTGPQPGWEISGPHAGETDLKSVSESLVVLQSLRQSRSKWVTTMFPKFSVKTRSGKTPEVTPPPHTTKAHGKYDLHVGPHVYHDTAIYEVHYLPAVEPIAEGLQTIQQPFSTPPATASSSGVQTSLSAIPFPAGTYVTPALSSKVSVAAQSNPVLANLLKAVISRTATDDQVKTLGLLIQSLEGVQALEQPNPTLLGMSAAQFSARPSSPRPFDVVLEFHERSSDRFILPRGDVVCELAAPKTESPYKASDAIITCCVPFANAASLQPTTPGAEPPDNDTPEVVSFRISRVSHAVWELLFTWAGGPQKIEESRVKLAEIAKQAGPHLYLKHRLPEGELLEEIRAAVAPSYTFRPVKPAGADSNKAKRKSVTRRPTVSIAAAPSASPEKPPPPPTPPVKRRAQQKAKASAPPPIACHSCGQRDVPLMMGGSKHFTHV